MNARFPRLAAQLYFLGLAAINGLHGVLPFFLRRGLYALCRFDIAPSATIQGGVRFFHVGRLTVGAHTLINRGVYLDNRAGIAIGSNVSVAHDVRIYTMGHDPHDATFATVGKPVTIGDRAVLFAGAMVMPGVTLGEGAVVMAGSVVTKSVPPMRMVGGNPAQDIGPRQGTPAYTLDRRHWFAH